MVHHYVETCGLNDCLVYTTEQPTAAPCHDSKVRFTLDLAQSQMEEKLPGHVNLLQTSWHSLYEADDYAVKALEALSWYEKNEHARWMPQAFQSSYGSWRFEPEEILKLKATYEAAEALSRMIGPRPEWGVFSERIARTLTDEFLKRRLKGEELDSGQFFERARETFGRGLKLAPWLAPFYELGYCSVEGRLFFADGDDVCMLEDEDSFGPSVVSTGVDGTTGSVREALRNLAKGEHNGHMPLKTFHGSHPGVFERMKERDPVLFHKLAVKILFRD